MIKIMLNIIMSFGYYIFHILYLGYLLKDGAPVGFDAFRKFLESKPENLKQFLKRFLSEELAQRYDIDGYGWLDMLLKESEDDPGVMTRAFREYNYEVGTLKTAYQ